MIEVLAALALIVVIAWTGASFYTQQKSFLDQTSTVSTCRAVLEGQMNYLRQQGTMTQGLPWNDVGGGVYPNPTKFSDPAIRDDLRYSTTPSPSDPIVAATSAPSGPGEVDPKTLLYGSLATLNSLYNSDPNVCQTGVDVSTLLPTSGSSQLPSILNPSFDHQALKNFKTTIQIQPIRLLESTPTDCTPFPLWVRPQGVQDFDANPPAKLKGAPLSAEYGYRVTLKGTYEDKDQRPQSCSTVSDFRYGVDRSQQVLAAVVTLGITPAAKIQSTSSPPLFVPSRPQCTHSPEPPPDLNVHISVRPENGGQIETGTVLMCADLSHQMNENYCIDADKGPAPNANMRGQVYPDVDGDGKVDSTPLTPQTGKWVPCSQVTACGIPPVSSTASSPADRSGGITYQLNYRGTNGSRDGLWGCDVRIDVATVDPAGNFKLLSAQHVGPNPWIESAGQAYFPPVECWGCYKKKKRNWGATLVAVTLIGPGGACLTGAAGVCRPRAVRFQGYKCSNSPSGGFCRKVSAKYPKWIPNPDQCPSSQRPFPSPYQNEANYTIPAKNPGESYEEMQIFKNSGGYCEVQAFCKSDGSRQWEGGLDEYNNISPIESCGKAYTRYKMNLSSGAIGSPAPTGTPECVLLVPDEAASIPVMTKADYSAFRICPPGGGVPNRTLCATDMSVFPPVTIYPNDAITGAASNTDPNRYYYFQNDIPVPDLPMCGP